MANTGAAEADAQVWEVVGGQESGGIVVRQGAELDSPAEKERLSRGALLREVELAGGRLRFQRLTGRGPALGWASLHAGRRDLVARSRVPLRAAQAAGEARASSPGAKVWIYALGSRGDLQPYLGLAVGLQRAGFAVRMFVTADFTDFVASWGVQATTVCTGLKGFKEEAMEEQILPDLTTWFRRYLPGATTVVLGALAAGPPDLLLYSTLALNAGLLAWSRFGVPAMMAPLSVDVFFDQRPGYFQSLADYAWVESQVTDGSPGTTPAQDMSVEDFSDFWHSAKDKLFGIPQMLGKGLATATAAMQHLPSVPPQVFANNDRYNFTGYWILDESLEAANPEAFGGQESRQRLEDFLAAGEPPVYLGWGSLSYAVDLPWMAARAVAALWDLGLRGVLAIGWGDVAWETMEQALRQLDPASCTQCMSYARGNVLFIKSAPHEWLFRRCCCTVHHGGAGTTAAALRSGVPTLVAAIFYDQPLFAEAVERLGAGLNLGWFDEVTRARLTAALREARAPSLRASARRCAELLRGEDGVLGALPEINAAVEDARSGKARQRWQAERARRGPAPGPRRKKARGALQFYEAFRLLAQNFGQNVAPVPDQKVQFLASDVGPAGSFVVEVLGGAARARLGEEPGAGLTVRLTDEDMRALALGNDEKWHYAGRSNEDQVPPFWDLYCLLQGRQLAASDITA